MPKQSLSRVAAIGACVVGVLSSTAHAGFLDDLVTRFPAAKGAKVNEAWPGFHSVVRGQEVIFIKDDLSILINGDVVDLNSGVSLTNQLRAANKQVVDISMLKESDAISFGTGSKKLYVFSDPDCPFCKQLQYELDKLKDTKVFIFPFPLTQLHPQAAVVSESIWCSKNPAATWNAYVLNGIRPKPANCENPIARNLALGSQLQIQGTPALIFEDGFIIPGAVPVARIEAQLAMSREHEQAKAAK